MKTIGYEEAVQMFDDALDEQGMVKILGYSFKPSLVLRELDALAYEESLDAFIITLRDMGVKVHDEEY